jgi:pyruvate/2-oxoglutarate dehydrogenase complex dihydrolipoamide dehydrogenase (E3) component
MRKLEVSEFMTKAVERNLTRHGIKRIQGHARFLPGRRVGVEQVGGEPVVLEAEVILLATGSKPRHLPGISMDDPDVHDSESILGIEEVPESMLVIGGGSLGCEYASIFAGLGVRVTVIDAGSHLLPALDVEMGECSPSPSTPWESELSPWHQCPASPVKTAHRGPSSSTDAHSRQGRFWLLQGDALK